MAPTARLRLWLLCTALCGCFAARAPPAGAKKNVLLMLADDLRPQLMAAYRHPFMKTPALDKFAATATTFSRAYVQQQVCSPSRNSFMTGRSPDQTGVWNFNDDFRVARPGTDPSDQRPGRGADWTTMPQYFKKMGYQVYGTGKTYHPNRPENNDMPRSWTDYSMGVANRSCNHGRVVMSSARNASTGEGQEWSRILGCEENDSEAMLTQAAIRFLKQATASESNKPFFIAMGHHRPHLPWNSPSRFIDQYGDPAQYPLARQQSYPRTASTMQWHPWFDQVSSQDIEPAIKQHSLRVGYYGAVSYYDYHFGLMLDALEESGQAQNTVVLVTGDHGWHLGERNMWEKKGLDELDTRVPLLVRVPWLASASSGRRTTAFAMSVDFFPTLVEMAGLPPCTEDLAGVSLGPVLRDPPSKGPGVGRKYAFSQFPRCNCTYQTSRPDSLNGTCPSDYINAWTHETGSTGAANHHVCLFTPASQFDWMGYRVRAESWSYTVFVAWDGRSLKPIWERVQSEELYAHDQDEETDFDGAYSEGVNLAVGAVSAAAKRVIAQLRPVLMKHFE